MQMDPSADEMMEDCHPCHSPLRTDFTCFRKKRWKIKNKQKTKDGLLAILKQIIGRGFVFRNKVAGMFSYSVSFVVFFEREIMHCSWILFVLLLENMRFQKPVYLKVSHS